MIFQPQFSLEELQEAIDRAFNLGKVYAIDELNEAGGYNNPRPNTKEWDYLMEGFGGLHSGSAKGDIIRDIIEGSKGYKDAFLMD